MLPQPLLVLLSLPLLMLPLSASEPPLTAALLQAPPSPAATSAPVLAASPAPAGPAGEAVPKSVLDPLLDDLAKRTGAERGSLEVVRAEETVFPDGSLGCPQPGMMYTQALVEGYRVVIRHAKKDYDYRAARRGHFVLCERAKTPAGEREPLRR